MTNLLLERYFRIRESLEQWSDTAPSLAERRKYELMLDDFMERASMDEQSMLKLLSEYELKTTGKTCDEEPREPTNPGRPRLRVTTG